MSNDRDPEEGDPLLLKNRVKVVNGADDDADAPEELDSFLEEAWDTIKLGIPIFVASLSWVGMKTTDSALLGHVSAKALAAASLSDLWTMCTGVLIQGRVLGILVGAAVGANNPRLAGIYLQVSYLVLFSISIFVMIAWWFTGTVWTLFGSDPKVASDAGYYATVLSLSIPAIIAFSQLSQFFSAQRILYPEVQTASMSMILNLTMGLIFVLGIPIPNFAGYGFEACPIVTTIVVYFQFAFMYLVYVQYQQLHKPCWDGWSWPDMTWTRIKTFSALYFPAAFGLASDYWRVAVIGGIAATFGEVDVAVFNTSYRIMWIVMILVGALTGAAGIRMSIRLGQMKPEGAKHAGNTAIQLSVMILAVLGVGIVTNIRFFGRIFTEDKDFLRLLEECRYPFTLTLILMNLSIAIEKIPYSMGRTTAVFYSGLIASWGAQVPAVYAATAYWRHDLVGLYWGMAVGYFALCLLYGYIAVTSDWKKYALLAQQRSEVEDK